MKNQVRGKERRNIRRVTIEYMDGEMVEISVNDGVAGGEGIWTTLSDQEYLGDQVYRFPIAYDMMKVWFQRFGDRKNYILHHIQKMLNMEDE